MAGARSWRVRWMVSQSYSLNRQGRWRRVPWGCSSWPPFVPSSPASPREWVVGLYPWERACSSFAAPVYWARYCPLASQVPFVRSCPRFSSWTLCPASLCRSCSSRSWFYFVRRSTVVARVWTCLSSAVDLSGSSSWTLLVVAIERVSTMQLLCSGSDNGLNCHRFPTDGANWWGRKSH